MTNRSGFNLLDEPWISVLAPDGREHELSILSLLNQAPRLVTIGGEVPTQGFAITRLLLAFLHRAIDGPKDQDEWAELWAAPQLPMERVRDYADRVHDRFNLFDPVAPFFQVPDLRTARNEVSGLEKIVADVPSGERLFTTRSSASLERISPAEAARWLVHAHAFDPSGIKSGAIGDPKVKRGKGYPIGTGWSGQLGGVLPEGQSLLETLLLNLVARDAASYVRIGAAEDLPPWERPIDGPAWDDDRPVHGAIDLYTWQNRRVRLAGNPDGVTGVVIANGDRITPQNRHRLEPHTAWRYSDPQSKKAKQVVYMPRMHDPQRSTWRGLGGLLPSVSGRRVGGQGEPQPFLAPGILQWISDLGAEGHLPDRFIVRTRIVGAEYGAQNATYTEIVDDKLPLAIALLREDHPALGRAAQGAVEDAERAASEVRKFAENLARAAGAEPKSGAGDRARERVYAALEEPYRRWLSDLGADTDPVKARASWQAIVRNACRPISDELLRAAPPSAWTGRTVSSRLVNVARAEAWFEAGLRKALPQAYESLEEPTTEVA